MMINRRHFMGTAAALALPQYSVRWARAETQMDRSLVVVFLRGGMDVLNFMAPVDDPFYLASRPAHLRVAGAGADKGLSLGGLIGGGDLLLNPLAAPLQSMWRKKQLAIIPAAGLNNATRSHFQAMDLIEHGVATDSNSIPRDGWLTRLAVGMGQVAPGSTLCLGGAMPQSLSMCESALPASDVWDVDWMPSSNFREVLLQMHSGNTPLDKSSLQAITATGKLASKLERNADNQPSLKDLPKGISYPDHDFGNKLRFLAEMMRVSPDIQIATADLDGWDTHDNQKDQFAPNLSVLAASLQAFHDHLDLIGRPTTVVVMSEFGRRIKANESGGTDHGHGGAMMVFGEGVNGGQNLGRWPGLAPEQLDQGMDLAVTTDFRDVLAAIIQNHGGQKTLASVFPNYNAQPLSGLFRTV